MAEDLDVIGEVYRFILEEIDSVPHLEALLLLWNSRPRPRSAADIAKALYVVPGAGKKILDDLARRGLVVSAAGSPDWFRYDSQSEEQNQLIDAVAEVYRRELVRISTMIHTKPSSAVREFANAFRFTKERH